MRDGFLKVMAATPDIRVADCDFNAENIIRAVGEAEAYFYRKIIVSSQMAPPRQKAGYARFFHPPV